MSEGQILGPGAGKVIELPGVTAVFKAVNDREPGDFVVIELTADPALPGPGRTCTTPTRNCSTCSTASSTSSSAARSGG